ncbi:MAG: GNAT family N-acetyltransferase [Methanobacteriota archaeon]
MDITIQYDCINIDWNQVSDILKAGEMPNFEGEVHKRAFENSYAVVFVFVEDTLVGFGRAISDGTYQAALYDVAVLPEYQGKQIGTVIVNSILNILPQCNFILYSAPGKEKFYKILNFRKMKTGMALFRDPELMLTKGFTE